MTNTKTISGYHVHVYFHDAKSKAKASLLREEMQQRFQIKISRLFEEADKNDPHQRPMFFARFSAREFADVVPWVMLNQNGLNVFIHPQTGDDLADHRDYPMWLGSVLPINLDGWTDRTAKAKRSGEYRRGGRRSIQHESHRALTCQRRGGRQLNAE